MHSPKPPPVPLLNLKAMVLTVLRAHKCALCLRPNNVRVNRTRETIHQRIQPLCLHIRAWIIPTHERQHRPFLKGQCKGEEYRFYLPPPLPVNAALSSTRTWQCCTSPSPFLNWPFKVTSRSPVGRRQQPPKLSEARAPSSSPFPPSSLGVRAKPVISENGSLGEGKQVWCPRVFCLQKDAPEIPNCLGTAQLRFGGRERASSPFQVSERWHREK